jgi:hypothetical protein
MRPQTASVDRIHHKWDKSTKTLSVLVIGVPKRFGLIHDGGILSPGRGPWLGVLYVGTRYGGIHLPAFLILFRQYIIRNTTSPKDVAIVQDLAPENAHRGSSLWT